MNAKNHAPPGATIIPFPRQPASRPAADQLGGEPSLLLLAFARLNDRDRAAVLRHTLFLAGLTGPRGGLQ